ncbi:MAG: OmpA family protein [Alistipes sp.]
MKRFILFLASVATAAMTAGYANAADYFINSKPHNKGFISNGFGDNWEIQAGAGTTFNICTGSGSSHAIMAGCYMGAGKWILPTVGIRLTGEYGKFAQCNPKGRSADWSYLFFHPDLMIDLTNWIDGYKSDRLWNTVVFMGGGVGIGIPQHSGKHTTQFVGTAGWQNRFRASKEVSVDVTLEYLLADASLRPEPCIRHHRFHGLNATIGITCRFNKRTFDRAGMSETEVKAVLEKVKCLSKSAADAETEARNARNEANRQMTRANRADEEIKRLESDNAALKEELQRSKSTSRTSKNDKKEAEILLYACGYSALTDEHKIQLDRVAERIDASSDKVFKIVGFADRGTGTPSANKRLAEKRARIVADYLIEKGVDANRLEVGSCGTAPCNIGCPEHNRVVAIY